MVDRIFFHVYWLAQVFLVLVVLCSPVKYIFGVGPPHTTEASEGLPLKYKSTLNSRRILFVKTIVVLVMVRHHQQFQGLTNHDYLTSHQIGYIILQVLPTGNTSPGDSKSDSLIPPWLEVHCITFRLKGHVFTILNGHRGGGNSNIFLFSPPILGDEEPNLTSIFSKWVGEKPPTRHLFSVTPQTQL